MACQTATPAVKFDHWGIMTADILRDVKQISTEIGTSKNPRPLAQNLRERLQLKAVLTQWSSLQCRPQRISMRSAPSPSSRFQTLKWGFPKIGVPLVIIHFSGIFPYEPSIWEYPHLWKLSNGYGSNGASPLWQLRSPTRFTPRYAASHTPACWKCLKADRK